MKKYNRLVYAALAVIFCVFASCSKWDDYKDYIKDGEGVYTGKIDSVKVYSGNLRARIVGLLPADPSIKECIISWKNNSLEIDSVVFPISKTGRSVVFDQTFAVDEGTKNFTIQTFDEKGNKSVKERVTGTIYGPEYASTLLNRPVNSAKLFDDGNTIIDWAGIDTTSGAQGTMVKYVDINNDTITKFTPISVEEDTLFHYKPGTDFKYNTVYLPDSVAIDTFYTDFVSQSVEADVTNVYLSNTGPGVARGDNSGGRFGVLGSPWIENAGAKNKDGGTVGGYTSDNKWGHNGQINWETWNNTPVVDGKIYQSTSQPLPAGDYTIMIHYYSELQSNSSVYCVAAAGANGIPSEDNLSDALASSSLFNGAEVGQTSPSKDGIQKFTFTLDTDQYVSIGFLGNIVGDGNPGSYLVIGYIKLIQNG